MDGSAIFTKGVMSECEKAMEDMDAPSGPGRDCTSPNVTQLTDCLGRYCRRHVVADCTCESWNRKRRSTADISSDDDGIELDEAHPAAKTEAHWAIRSFSRTRSSPDMPSERRASKRHMGHFSGSGFFQPKPALGLWQFRDVRKGPVDFRVSEDASSFISVDKCARAQVVPEREDSNRSSSTVLSLRETEGNQPDLVSSDKNLVQDPEAPHRSSTPVPSCGRMLSCEDVDLDSSRPVDSCAEFAASLETSNPRSDTPRSHETAHLSAIVSDASEPAISCCRRTVKILKWPRSSSSARTKVDGGLPSTDGSSPALFLQWPAFERPPSDARSDSSQESAPLVTQARPSFRMPSLYSDNSGILTRPSPSASPNGSDAAAESMTFQLHPPTFRADWFRPIDAVLTSTPEDQDGLFTKTTDEPADSGAATSSRYPRWELCGAGPVEEPVAAHGADPSVNIEHPRSFEWRTPTWTAPVQAPGQAGRPAAAMMPIIIRRTQNSLS